MPRHVGAAAAVIDEQPDQQVSGADHVLVGDRGIERFFADVNGGLELDAVAAGGIIRLVPGAHRGQNLGDVDGFLGGGAVDLQQRIAVLEAGLGGRAVGIDVQGLHAARRDRPRPRRRRPGGTCVVAGN